MEVVNKRFKERWKMLLSDKALKDFKELYLKEYRISLTDNEALEYGNKLIGLVKAVYGNDLSYNNYEEVCIITK